MCASSVWGKENRQHQCGAWSVSVRSLPDRKSGQMTPASIKVRPSGHCQRLSAHRGHLVQFTTDKKRPEALRFYEALGFVASHEGMKLKLGEHSGND